MQDEIDKTEQKDSGKKTELKDKKNGVDEPIIKVNKGKKSQTVKASKPKEITEEDKSESSENNDENKKINIQDNKKQNGYFYAIALGNIVCFPKFSFTCDINNEEEATGVDLAYKANEPIVVVQSNKVGISSVEDFEKIGCLCKINNVVHKPNGTLRAFLMGTTRVEVSKVYKNNGIMVKADPVLDVNGDTQKSYAMMMQLRKQLKNLSADQVVSPNLQEMLLDSELEPAEFANLLSLALSKDNVKLQKAFLNEIDVEKRLQSLCDIVSTLIANLDTNRYIERKVNENLAKTQREIYLREQLHVINDELNGCVDEAEEFAEKVKQLHMPKDLEEKTLKEISRLNKLPFGSPEIGYVRNFIETVLELPWDKRTSDNINIKKARNVLDSEHYALEDVKKRILELLAVIKLTGKVNAQIICLAGPPGVGKTSIAKSIAKAMGRKFTQISLGGVSDESVIRGHRRTYVGAMCGRILAGMKQAGTVNPVFLLDEIDKMARSNQGDPASALLEVLDPAQNDHFKDNFLEMPYDLSQVLFIVTANYIENIPEPLKDRMEIIELRSYTEIEKIHIAQQYLIPKQEKLAGLRKGAVKLSPELLSIIINQFTFEAGVRSLERKIAEICRKYAVAKVTGVKPVPVSEKNITDYLGHNGVKTLDVFKGGNVGQVPALSVVGSITGDVMLVEAALSEGKGEITLTCKPGKMMQESSKIAYALLKSRALDWGIQPSFIKETDVNLSIPQTPGGVEGPSAGITMTTAMVSAFTNNPVRAGIGMTGEISLSGRVYPIGGLRDKLIAASRIGLVECVIPKDNEDDLWDLPDEVRSKLKIHLVENIDEVLSIALTRPLKKVKREESEIKDKKSE